MQFDVFRNLRGGLRPLLLDLQSELFVQLATRVVVPLAPVLGPRVGSLANRRAELVAAIDLLVTGV